MTRTPSILAVAFSALTLGACAAGVDSDEGVATTGGEQAALDQPAERPDRLERRLEHMQARLDLTDEQVEQLRPVLERMRSERQALRDLPPDERREAAGALHDEMRAALEPILTEEQLAQAERMFERHRGRHGGPGFRGPRGHRGPPDPDHAIEAMREHIGLTDAQAEQVRPILEQADQRRSEIRDLPRDERREAAEALHQQVHDQLAQVLSDEQLQQLEERFQRHHGRHGGPGFRGPRGPRGPGGPDAPAEAPPQAL